MQDFLGLPDPYEAAARWRPLFTLVTDRRTEPIGAIMRDSARSS